MATKRTGLGRGLDALLGDVAVAADRPVDGDDELRLISVDLLRRGAYQPRQDMHPESLEDLARSIEAQGLVQPILVRPLDHTDRGGAQQYEIIAGERRWRAAQIAGLEKIPAVVREIPNASAIAVALIENIQREDLNPLEESLALRRLIDEFELTHQQAADAIGRSRAAVSNLLRLLELGDVAKALVQSGELEMGHARALLGLEDQRRQAEVAALVAKKGLSVRETERLVGRMVSGEAPGKNRRRGPQTVDPDVRRLEDDLGERLGARVEIRHGARGRGQLVVSYSSLDELEGILAHIK